MPLRRNSKLKIVIDVLLSFFTALTLIVAATCAILYLTVCNGNYMLFAVNRSGYQQLNLQELQEDLSYIADPIGIDASLLTDAIDGTEIKENVEQSIKKAYQDESFTPDTAAFTGKIYNTITTYAAENDLTVNEENFEHASDACGSIYTDHSAISYVSSIGHYAANLRLPLLIASIVCLLVAVILIRQLWHMHYRKYMSIRFMIFGLSGAGLSLLALPLMILSSGRIDKASVSPESLYSLFVTYCDFLFQLFVFAGLFILVIALILVVFYRKHRKAFLGKY